MMQILIERTSMGRALAIVDDTGRAEYRVDFPDNTNRLFSSRTAAVRALRAKGGQRDTLHGMDAVGGKYERN